VNEAHRGCCEMIHPAGMLNNPGDQNTQGSPLELYLPGSLFHLPEFLDHFPYQRVVHFHCLAREGTIRLG
jgi:hypothetical protein